MKVHKKYIAIIILLVVVSLIFVLTRPYQRWNFKGNGRDEPYAQGIPLYEMNWSMYKRYFGQMSMSIYPPVLITAKISLPCNVHYYVRTEDVEPVLTLEKGTEVYIMPIGEDDLYDGYGLVCWPDYQKGWRYGEPLTDNRTVKPSSIAQKYYVKTSELDKVAQSFYKQNKGYCEKIKCNSGRAIVRKLDRILYDAGAFCSNDLP